MASSNTTHLTKLPSASHTHTIVFLHGRGSTAVSLRRSLEECFTSSGHNILQAVPSLRWVFPQAPFVRPLAQPKDLVPQWFDVFNIDNFKDCEDLQAVGLRESIMSITDLLKDEVNLLGGRWDKVVLAGISQGAATALHTLINLDIPVRLSVSDDIHTTSESPAHLAALVLFSCRMPFPNRPLSATRAKLGLPGAPSDAYVLRHTPILLEHCLDDQRTPVSGGAAVRHTLKAFGAKAVWKEYTGGGHWFNMPCGMDDLVVFLQESVPGLEKVNEQAWPRYE